MTLGRSSSGAIKIKTDGGLRAVSCGCCEPSLCCFYHAQALADGLFTVDDLPDEIIYKNPFGDPMTLFKGVWFYGSFDFTNIPGAYFGRPEPEFEDVVLYYGEESYSLGWKAAQGLTTSPGMCLFSPDFEDTFADVYQISGPMSGSVTRQSACIWRGNGITLEYNGSIGGFGDQGDPAIGTFKWQVNGNDKSGFQNTPVGTYEGGFTIS